MNDTLMGLGIILLQIGNILNFRRLEKEIDKLKRRK